MGGAFLNGPLEEYLTGGAPADRNPPRTFCGRSARGAEGKAWLRETRRSQVLVDVHLLRPSLIWAQLGEPQCGTRFQSA